MRRLTIIESPLSSKNGRTMDENIVYLRLCMQDSWRRGELPFASHQWGPFFLNEHDINEREAGIKAGYLFWDFVTLSPGFEEYGGEVVRTMVPNDEPLIVLYMDYGFSIGMNLAYDRVKQLNRPHKFRVLFPEPKEYSHVQDTQPVTK